jgi:hypothetical protein
MMALWRFVEVFVGLEAGWGFDLWVMVTGRGFDVGMMGYYFRL